MHIGPLEPSPVLWRSPDPPALLEYHYKCLSDHDMHSVHDSTQGCSCSNCGFSDPCVCLVEHHRGMQALQAQGRSAELTSLLECGPACRCTSECRARSTQGGVKVPLSVGSMPGKGWGVTSLVAIPTGNFVCEYVGEVLSTSDAQRRLKGYDQHRAGIGHALLVTRIVLPSSRTTLRINIDATRKSNVAHFINHSCDGGNLVPVIVTCKGALIPRICLFAARDIQANEELTFSYGEPYDGRRGVSHCAARPCACGTTACLGFLPCEDAL